MLSDAFTQFEQARQARTAARTAARAQRDQFIAVNFPALDLAFVGIIDAATGANAKLQVVKNSVVDTFTGRGFASLTKTVTTITSTLYADPESVTFTPALESIDPDQFGVIRIDAPAPGVERARLTGLQQSIMQRGILMRGDAAAHLVAVDGTNYAPLDSARLEGLLMALFIRGY